MTLCDFSRPSQTIISFNSKIRNAPIKLIFKFQKIKNNNKDKKLMIQCLDWEGGNTLDHYRGVKQMVKKKKKKFASLVQGSKIHRHSIV